MDITIPQSKRTANAWLARALIRSAGPLIYILVAIAFAWSLQKGGRVGWFEAGVISAAVFAGFGLVWWLSQLSGPGALRTTIISVAAFVAFVAAWWFLPPLYGSSNVSFPSLPRVLDEGAHLTVNFDLVGHTIYTLYEVVVGFILGSLMGAGIGYLLGVSPTGEKVASPYILALQIAPKVAFAPIFVSWMGYNEWPRILTAVLIVFFPILINVLSAVRTVDQAQIDLARSFKATRWQIFRKIEFPASIPALFSGLRIGATLAVIGVTVAEFLGGDKGLGYVLAAGEGAGSAGASFAVIILLTLVGIVLYLLVVLAEMWVLRYMPKRDSSGMATGA